MFGYIKTFPPELKLREYDFYRAAYCGLCRSMGECTGLCSRLTLDYDFVFLALVRISLTGETAEFDMRRCLAHPHKKRASMKRNPSLDYSARAAAILAHYKISDDAGDEKGLKKAISILLKPFSAHMLKRALRSDSPLAELEEKIRRELARLSECENQKTESVDAPAVAFGNLLGEIFAFSLPEREAKIAYGIGFHTGKWIYIADALDDIGEDAKKGAYNPFLLLYRGEIPSEAELENISLALKNELFGLEAALDLVDFGENETAKNILYNIIYLGIPAKAKAIAEKYLTYGKSRRKEQYTNEQ